ncbi:TIGR02302 family protein [Neorhizobium sp. T786]|uniref:TIGR02302 family protein n=1 Tax=Pseudorhizobium xiangyangii TaxID=2883104 RepID=UPI001CFF54F7|nr:TIGR02302 family protein [Neorhizobium xiangyangii]MCB5204474.1 TIGR02302 family protein [Neorhizobium xiangyangii]
MSITRKGAFHALPALARRVALKRSLARCVLFFERLTPRLLPLLCITALFLAFTWFGLFRIVPDIVRWIVLAVFGLGFLATLMPIARIRWPAAGEADRLLEERNNLQHQPVAVQEDVPAFETPFARALWTEHQIRMAERIAGLDTGLPRPDIARHDRFALRAVPALLVAAAFGFSFSNGAGSIGDAFRPAALPVSTNPDLRIDAWLTPPSYTGRAPIFLTGRDAQAANTISIPQNSELTVRVTGGEGGEAVTFASATNGDPTPLVSDESAYQQQPGPEAATTPAQPPSVAAQDLPPPPRSYLMKIAESGELNVNGESWTFDVIPDRPPEIAFDNQPKRAVNGALEIGYTGKDDYGIRDAHAIIEAVEPQEPGATPLYPLPEYRLDLPRRNTREIKAVSSRNLTEHPLAGKRVRITLVATDGAGQTARSPSHEMVLPGRPFSEPLAAAVAEQRQVFSLDTRQMPHAIELNEVLALRPDETIPNLSHFLLIRSALGRMELARDNEQLKQTADYLWEIALGIEDGDLSAAERRLRDAQNALQEALENDASDEEIAKLMDELREAMQEFMSELAQRLQNSPRMQQDMQAENFIRQRDLQNMMDQIENLARSGNRDAAQQMLSELQRMMNNLQAGRMPQGQQGQQQNSPMRQQIDKLGEIMQEQQRLMDETFQLDQALRDRMQRGDPGQEGEQPYEQGQRQPGEQEQQDQQGQQGSPTDQMTAEQLREALKNLRAQQEGLGKQLQELQQGLKDLGMQPGEGFGEAESEMGKAGKALGEGEGEQAVQGQGNALNALRKGAQDMMQQMMQAMQQGQGQGQGEGPGQLSQGNQNGRDPLGRPRSTAGPDFGDQVKVPDEIDVQRAREILEAIRERLGNALSGESERRYLERLLEIR